LCLQATRPHLRSMRCARVVSSFHYVHQEITVRQQCQCVWKSKRESAASSNQFLNRLYLTWRWSSSRKLLVLLCIKARGCEGVAPGNCFRAASLFGFQPRYIIHISYMHEETYKSWRRKRRGKRPKAMLMMVLFSTWGPHSVVHHGVHIPHAKLVAWCYLGCTSLTNTK
jgi:hypothetical protein